MRGRILVVDDQKDMLLLLKRIITEETEHEVVTEFNSPRALELIERDHFDIILTDLRMPGLNGIQLLEEAKKIRPEVSVVLLTAYGAIDNAVEAIRKGAYDYLTKPFKRERVLLTVKKLMDYQRIRMDNAELRMALEDIRTDSFFLGSSPGIQAVFDKIKRAAPTMATVLITGQSGTGKELAARSIHKHSLRADKKMVTVNCTSIPENVLESEFFGHVKGAFTGAWKDKKGLVEEADGGTLFLDEIGDLSPAMQTKLLRLLQEGEYKPVGGVTTRKADVRFIAATNHNLKQDIKEKLFREDLYYRLNVINFEMPPLSRRRDDIPVLAHHFLIKYSRINQKEIKEIAPAAIQALMSHEYHGNVRELENMIERGVIFSETDRLNFGDLGLTGEESLLPEIEQELSDLTFREAKGMLMDAFHRQYICQLLAKTGGNVRKAAEAAGIQRQYLHKLLKELGIETGSFKNPEERYR